MSVLIKSTTYLNNISKKNCRAAKNGLQCFEYKFTSMGNECKHISQFSSTGTTLLSSLNGGLIVAPGVRADCTSCQESMEVKASWFW